MAPIFRPVKTFLIPLQKTHYRRLPVLIHFHTLLNSLHQLKVNYMHKTLICVYVHL